MTHRLKMVKSKTVSTKQKQDDANQHMSSQLQRDQHYMQRAIMLAKRGRFTTSPNPNVGCVLVKNDEVIGEGWHQKAGLGHAEVNALANVSEDVAGATAYVTLEPCSHYGRTPPCAEGLINAGVKRVVIGMQDPNPVVSGNGVKMLNAAGIETSVGVLESAARALNPGFIKRMETGMPFVQCKMASSLDGRTAMANGESKWITGPSARKDVQQFRAMSCAIISGADTVIVDDAKLNVRFAELTSAKEYVTEETLRQPVRVIIDTKHRLTPNLALFAIKSPIILVRTNNDEKQPWPEHVECLQVNRLDDKADLTDLLKQLGKKGFNHLWLESGARLSGAFMAAKLVDELILYQAPKIMASEAKGLFDIEQLTNLADAIALTLDDVRMVGDDIRIRATVKQT